MRSKLLDTSSELVIERFQHGVKLVAPKNIDPTNSNRNNISNIMKLPMNVYFLNTDSSIQNINEHTIETAGFLSVNDTIGKTVEIAANREAAKFCLDHDAMVLKSNRIQIAIEKYVRQIDEFEFSALSIKYPWYNQSNKLIGVFGFSLVPEDSSNPFSLAKSLSILLQTGLLDQHSLNLNKNNTSHILNATHDTAMKYDLSDRQMDCLDCLLNGMSSKQIAKRLLLSPRTVEHYIEALKIKMNCTSRVELFEKGLEMRKSSLLIR